MIRGASLFILYSDHCIFTKARGVAEGASTKFDESWPPQVTEISSVTRPRSGRFRPVLRHRQLATSKKAPGTGSTKFGRFLLRRLSRHRIPKWRSRVLPTRKPELSAAYCLLGLAGTMPNRGVRTARFFTRPSLGSPYMRNLREISGIT